jgi:hypothetical protein
VSKASQGRTAFIELLPVTCGHRLALCETSLLGDPFPMGFRSQHKNPSDGPTPKVRYFDKFALLFLTLARCNPRHWNEPSSSIPGKSTTIDVLAKKRNLRGKNCRRSKVGRNLVHDCWPGKNFGLTHRSMRPLLLVLRIVYAGRRSKPGFRRLY